MISSKLELVKHDVLFFGADDPTVVVSFLTSVCTAFRLKQLRAGKRLALRLLQRCIEEELIEVGDLCDSGTEVSSWNLPVTQILSRISAQWEDFLSGITATDIGWFATTPRGEEWLKRFEEGHEHFE